MEAMQEVAQKVDGSAPDDVQLQAQLEKRLQGAQKAAGYHRAELRRAQRITDACKAGLEQLQQADDEPAEDTAEGF